MALIPPWLAPPDVANQYAGGLRLGAQIAQEQNRLNAENARTTMEAQARAETNARTSELEKARLATEAAYRRTNIELQQDRLAQAKRVVDQRTQEAALKVKDQLGFQRAVASGAPIDQSLAMFPRANAAPTANLAHQQTMETQAAQRDTQAHEDRAARLAFEQQKATQPKPAPLPRTVTTIKPPQYEGGQPTTNVTQTVYGQPGAGTPVPKATQGDISQDKYDKLPVGATYSFGGKQYKKKAAKADSDNE